MSNILVAKDGMQLKDISYIKNMIPSSSLEKIATTQYIEIKNLAKEKRVLLPDTHPKVIHLRKIAREILPYTKLWNIESSKWIWEINVIVSDEINAFCMPGGKIIFYTGILEKIQLSEDEIAIIMGHEIAHALREHIRVKIAKEYLTNTGKNILSQILGIGEIGGHILKQGVKLLNLSFSRSDEKDADLVGIDLVARAGYDPRAAISLWKKMKQINQEKSHEWLSTHPYEETRIFVIRKHLQSVLPLYAKAKGTDIDNLPTYKY